MVSKEYENASKTLDALIEQTEKLKQTNYEFEKAVLIHKDLTDALNTATEIFSPLMRTYLQDLTGIRMGIGREVQDILRSIAELKNATKGVDELIKFVETIYKLKAILTPEFAEILSRLSRPTARETREVIVNAPHNQMGQ